MQILINYVLFDAKDRKKKKMEVCKRKISEKYLVEENKGFRLV